MAAIPSAMPMPNLLLLFHQRKTPIAPMASSAPRECEPIAANADSAITAVMPCRCHRFVNCICT